MLTYDTIIIGLGAMGSAAAYQLAARGRRVLGIEQFTRAHDLGSSHGQSRIIRQAYFEDPVYVPLLLRAYELWEQTERDAGAALLHITGGLMIGAQDSAVVRGSIRSAEEHGLDYAVLDARDIRRRWPVLTPEPDVVALYEGMAGILFPEAAIKAHLRLAAERGAELRFEEAVLDWEAAPDGSSVRVTTARGSYTATSLIIAAGAYAPPLLDGLVPLTVQRNVLFWFEPDRDRAQFQPECFPIYIWEMDGGRTFYGFPELNGEPRGVKVAFHNDGPLCTPETIDRVIHKHEIARMREALANRIPALSRGALVAAKTCMYTLTPDQHFALGVHPRHPQVVVASPCSGHGFKFASVMGEALADLATDRATLLPIAPFRLDRSFDA